MQFRRGRIFLLLVAVACGRETFDLLPTDSGNLEPGAGGESAGGAGDGSGGAAEPAGAGETHGDSGREGDPSGGEPARPPPAGGSTSIGGTAGTAGSWATAGSAGSSGAAVGGSAGEPDWASGGAPDGHCDGPPMRNECRPSATPCIRCNPDQENPNADCAGTEVPYCDPFDRHCVECLPSYGPEPSSCAAGEGCYPLTLTCQPLCRDPLQGPTCPQEAPFCRPIDQKPSMCVECVYSTDCAGRGNARTCARGLCVECIDNWGCDWNPYAPTCVNYSCQGCSEDCDCEPFERCNRDTGACIPR